VAAVAGGVVAGAALPFLLAALLVAPVAALEAAFGPHPFGLGPWAAEPLSAEQLPPTLEELSEDAAGEPVIPKPSRQYPRTRSQVYRSTKERFRHTADSSRPGSTS